MYSVVTTWMECCNKFFFFARLMIADLEKTKHVGYFHCLSTPSLFEIHLVAWKLLLPPKDSSFNTYFEKEGTSYTNIKTALGEPNGLLKWVIM